MSSSGRSGSDEAAPILSSTDRFDRRVLPRQLVGARRGADRDLVLHRSRQRGDELAQQLRAVRSGDRRDLGPAGLQRPRRLGGGETRRCLRSEIEGGADDQRPQPETHVVLGHDDELLHRAAARAFLVEGHKQDARSLQDGDRLGRVGHHLPCGEGRKIDRAGSEGGAQVGGCREGARHQAEGRLALARHPRLESLDDQRLGRGAVEKADRDLRRLRQPGGGGERAAKERHQDGRRSKGQGPPTRHAGFAPRRTVSQPWL